MNMKCKDRIQNVLKVFSELNIRILLIVAQSLMNTNKAHESLSQFHGFASPTGCGYIFRYVFEKTAQNQSFVIYRIQQQCWIAEKSVVVNFHCNGVVLFDSYHSNKLDTILDIPFVNQTCL